MPPDNDIYQEARAILKAVGDRLGVPVQDARLLRLHSNASFALPDEGLLIRIATNPAAYARVAASIEVTRWLADRGFPCVVPADVKGQPFTERGRVVSVWRYVPTTTGPTEPGAELGRLLRLLHAQPDPPCPPGRFTDPFYSVASAIDEVPDAMPEPDRAWLRNQIAALRDRWNTLVFPWPPGLIHGDAHVNNLMHATSGQVLLGDWDHVAIGPREWDLMQIHFIHRRFGTATEHDLDSFAAAYGWDIRDWPGLGTLIAVREITGLSAHIRTAPGKPFTREQLIYRLDTLRRGDVTARWTSPPG
jgi:aminoglycoside phosphotransferase (APT) family kinase protein